MSLFELFVNAVHVSEVEDGFISNRKPMTPEQRKAVFASFGGTAKLAGGKGGGGKGNSSKPPKSKYPKPPMDPTAPFEKTADGKAYKISLAEAVYMGFESPPDAKKRPYAAQKVHELYVSKGRPSPYGAKGPGVEYSYAAYNPPVSVKDIQPPWSPERDLARRISEYEDRTGQRWPGPTTTDGMPPNYPGGGTAPPMPIDPGGAIGQDSQGNPIFRGPNGQPVVYDRRTGGLRPPGLQMPAIPARGPQLGGPGGPVKTVTSVKGLSVEEAAARRNETKPGTIERLIAEQDLMVAMKIEDNRRRALGGPAQLIAVDDTSPAYNPQPGYGTPPSQRGGIRSQEFRDSDGDRIDDRDQDGPGMPKYGTPGYKPGVPDQRILPIEPPVRTLPVRDDMRDIGYNPTPGYGTPPSQRGGMRTQEFRDSDGDRIDDRDQDGPGMPRYGRPGVGAPGLVTTPGFRVPDQFGPPLGYIPPNSREPAQPRIPGQPNPGQGFKKGPDGRVVYDPGVLPPSWRNSSNSATYVPPHNRYSSADQNWKYKMLAEQNKGTIAGRMAERRVQMTEPGWRVEMGGQMSGSYVPETLRRVRQFGFLS